MKRVILSLLAALALVLPVHAGNRSATLFNPETGAKKVVEVGCRSCFDGGWRLYATPTLGGTAATSSLPWVLADFETSLTAKIGSSDTSFSLSSGTTGAGNSLNGWYGFTIDAGSASREYVIASCSGATCTSAVRGVSTDDGITPVTALKKEHRKGASVKITDHPALVRVLRILNGLDTVPDKLTYSSSPIISGSGDIVNKAYVDSVMTGLVGNSSTSSAGTIKISSAPASPASPVALNSEEVATTSAANKVPRADSNGDLDPNYINQGSNYAWTGSSTWAGTSTFNGTNTMSTTTFTGITKVPTSTPTLVGQVVGLDASSKLPAVDGSQLTNLPNNYLGAGISTNLSSYYNYVIPMASANWTETGFGSSVWKNIYWTVGTFSNTSNESSPIVSGAGTQKSFSDNKKIIADFTAKQSGISGNGSAGWGIATSTAAIEYNYASSHHAIFVVNSATGNLYAQTSNGVNVTDTQITGITTTNDNQYRIEYNPGVSVLFYVNGILKATVVTNLPSTGNVNFVYGQKISSGGANPAGVSNITVAVER